MGLLAAGVGVEDAKTVPCSQRAAFMGVDDFGAEMDAGSAFSFFGGWVFAHAKEHFHHLSGIEYLKIR